MQKALFRVETGVMTAMSWLYDRIAGIFVNHILSTWGISLVFYATSNIFGGTIRYWTEIDKTIPWIRAALD